MTKEKNNKKIIEFRKFKRSEFKLSETTNYKAKKKKKNFKFEKKNFKNSFASIYEVNKKCSKMKNF